MKKALLILAVSLLAFTANAGTITRSFNNLKEFDGINISNSFDATLIKGDDYSATVTIDTYYDDYLDVSIVGTVLYVRMKELPPSLKNLTRKTMDITITVPSITRLYLTGTASVTSDDEWVTPVEQFTLNLSGASKAEKLRISGAALKAEISDASKCSVIGDFISLDADISGASAATFSSEADDITLKTSGTSKATFVGKAESINAICTGSSYMEGSALKVNDAVIKCKGASKATIEAQESLDVDLTGASTCHYRSKNDALKVTPSISRASSFKKIN
ncbi:MAG: DUF2807 domain-containing protein [Bacteroidales bacterium]|nr:DUF2807 domain-containing protein [Bacteroidales bacterium]